MNIIYLDTLFLVNFLCDYILLLCTAKVCGAEIRRGLLFTSSTIGGLYACLCTLPRCLWLRQPLMQGVCCILLCIMAFWHEQRLLQCIVSFLCISATVGGVLSALSISFGRQLYLPMDIKATFLGFAAVYAALTLFFRRFPQLRQQQVHSIAVTLNETTVRFKAMRDTGNELYDPITNLPVLICETNLLKPLFPNNSLSFDDTYAMFLRLNETDEYKNKMKLIPYRTISDTGILLGFRPDALKIDDTEEHYIVAFSPKPFTTTAAYQAIF